MKRKNELKFEMIFYDFIEFGILNFGLCDLLFEIF
jgi:hypothetical protein